MQVEEATHKVDNGGGFWITRRGFQGADRGVHDFVDDATSQRLDGQFLVGGHGTEAPANPINLGLANGFEVVLQADDGGNHVESLQASVEFFDFAIDDRFRLFGFLLAIGDVRRDRLLQIVDVIDEDAIDLVHLRIDVAGNGDIDKEHGLVFAQRHELFAVFGPADEGRRAGRGNYDVGAITGVIKAVELDRLSVKFLRQPDGAVVGAVGDKERGGAVREQMGGRYLH